MLQSLRYAPPQAQRAHSQRDGATIKGGQNLESAFNYAIQHTEGEKEKLIGAINATLFELRANELPQYGQFQVWIKKDRTSRRLSAILQNPSVNQLKLLEVQLKPENASTYEGNLLEYLRDALNIVLTVYRRHCPKPIKDTAVQAVSA